MAVVTDSTGCISTAPVTINEPAVFSASIIDSTGVSCFGDSNGTATVTAMGGVPPYTYAWSNGETTATADSLYAGIHSVIVTDTNGCTTVASVVITEPAPLTSGITDSTDAGCGTICNGTATVSVSGGTPPYNYLWGNPAAQTDSFADSLCLGINEVTITDTNGCITTDSVMISAPPILIASNIVTNASCNTISDGAIDLTVTGGSPPYTYLWLPGGDTTQDLTNVFPDTFIVVITDSTGCSITDTAIVSVLITVIADAGLDISICTGDVVTLTATATGSNFLWSPGSTLNDSTILNPLATPDTTTVYVLTVNAGACTDRDTIMVSIVLIDAGEDVTIANEALTL